uniref:hypothetical protein n=1 Tax=Acetatifactor sp. TaxID=1872090 RepID=UPI004057AAAB
MQTGLVKIICQIAIFMICAQAIVHFRPKVSYEKYLKMLLSAMIMIQILASIGGVFWGSGKMQLSERISYFTDTLNEKMQETSGFAVFSEENSEITFLEDMSGAQEDVRQEIAEIGEISVKIAPVETIRVGEAQE